MKEDHKGGLLNLLDAAENAPKLLQLKSSLSGLGFFSWLRVEGLGLRVEGLGFFRWLGLPLTGSIRVPLKGSIGV